MTKGNTFCAISKWTRDDVPVFDVTNADAIKATGGKVAWIWGKDNIMNKFVMLSCKAGRRPMDRPPAGDTHSSWEVSEEVLGNSALFRSKGESRKVDVGSTLGYGISESRDKAKGVLYESLEFIVICRLQVYSAINL